MCIRDRDRHGEWFELEAEDLLARCIQHENDHLDGITIMESSEFFYEDTEEGRAAAALSLIHILSRTSWVRPCRAA